MPRARAAKLQAAAVLADMDDGVSDDEDLKPKEKRLRARARQEEEDGIDYLSGLPPDVLLLIVDEICDEMGPGGSRQIIALGNTCRSLNRALDNKEWWMSWIWQRYGLRPRVSHPRAWVIARIRFECPGCGVVAPKTSGQIDYLICRGCRKYHPDYRLISGTDAKTEFHVNDKELAELECYFRRNLEEVRKGTIRFFAVSDVRKLAEAKFAAKGSSLAEKKEKLQSRRPNDWLTTWEELQAKKLDRATELRDALAALGLTTNDGYYIAKAYIEDRLRWYWREETPTTSGLQTTVDAIARKHLLAEHTRFSTARRRYYDPEATNAQEKSAIAALEKFEREGNVPDDAKMCRCGRKLLSDYLPGGRYY